MNPPPITLLLRPPTVTLTEWTVFAVALHSLEGAPTWHLVGMEVNGHASDPRVSSPIIAVDNVMRTCATRGGDVYHLKGESSIFPGQEILEWAAWKESLRVQSDTNVTAVITDAFTRLEQQLYAYQLQRPDDFPSDWFAGIPINEDEQTIDVTLDVFELDGRHDLCLRLALQCARLYQHELGNAAHLSQIFFDTLVQEVLQHWQLSIRERRWIAAQARQIELD